MKILSTSNIPILVKALNKNTNGEGGAQPELIVVSDEETYNNVTNNPDYFGKYLLISDSLVEQSGLSGVIIPVYNKQSDDTNAIDFIPSYLCIMTMLQGLLEDFTPSTSSTNIKKVSQTEFESISKDSNTIYIVS